MISLAWMCCLSRNLQELCVSQQSLEERPSKQIKEEKSIEKQSNQTEKWCTGHRQVTGHRKITGQQWKVDGMIEFLWTLFYCFYLIFKWFFFLQIRSNRSPSWEDMESVRCFLLNLFIDWYSICNSVRFQEGDASADAVSDTVDECHGFVPAAATDSSVQATTNSLKQLVKRNARSFNLQNKVSFCI